MLCKKYSCDDYVGVMKGDMLNNFHWTLSNALFIW
jgi:hypothetical protein